jgi:hypothetical protein
VTKPGDPITWQNIRFKETRLASRSDHRTQSGKKGAPPKFVKDAAKWRLFDRTVSQVRNAFSDMPADQLKHMTDKAVASVRKEKRRKSKARRRK